jgi:hypothetical protein
MRERSFELLPTWAAFNAAANIHDSVFFNVIMPLTKTLPETCTLSRHEPVLPSQVVHSQSLPNQATACVPGEGLAHFYAGSAMRFLYGAKTLQHTVRAVSVAVTVSASVSVPVAVVAPCSTTRS